MSNSNSLEKFRVAVPSKRDRRLLLGAGAQTQNKPVPSLADIVAEYQKSPKRCAILFDATGSMQPYWDNVSGSLREICSRLSLIGGAPSVRITAYRDDCDGDRILEQTRWTTDVADLHGFISHIVCSGGGDTPEAVDRALSTALTHQEHIDVVILVGDAPPHSDRNGLHEAARLGEMKRPVYPIVVGGSADARKAFGEIARLSGGKLLELHRLEDLFELLGVLLAHSLGKEALRTYVDVHRQQLPARVRAVAGLLTE